MIAPASSDSAKVDALSAPSGTSNLDGERRKAVAPAAFAAAVERARLTRSPEKARHNPFPLPNLRALRANHWVTGIVGAGALLAALWIGALLVFPDQIAQALAPAQASSLSGAEANVASVVKPSATAIVLTSTPTSTPTSTVQPTVTPESTPMATPAAETDTPDAGLFIPSRLIIPAIEVDALVEPVSWTLISRGETTEAVWDVASKAVGWHLYSAMPGEKGNVVLAGHHNIDGMVFRDLYKLEAGAEIRLLAGPVAYTYRVDEVMIVPERGVSEEQREENARWIGTFPDERVTLVSCWPPYDNSHRVIVVAFPKTVSESP